MDSALALKGTLGADTATAATRVEVATTTTRDKSVFNVEVAVLDVGSVRRPVAVSGRRLAGEGIVVVVNAFMSEQLL